MIRHKLHSPVTGRADAPAVRVCIYQRLPRSPVARGEVPHAPGRVAVPARYRHIRHVCRLSASPSPGCIFSIEKSRWSVRRLFLAGWSRCRWPVLAEGPVWSGSRTEGRCHQGNLLPLLCELWILTFDWIHIRKLREPPRWGLFCCSCPLNNILPSCMMSDENMSYSETKFKFNVWHLNGWTTL